MENDFLYDLTAVEYVVRSLRISEKTRLICSPQTPILKEAADLAREMREKCRLLAILMDGRRDALATRKK